MSAQHQFDWACKCLGFISQNKPINCCIAPGSRSTPFTLSAASLEHIHCYTHFDERSLGFFALGLTKSTKKPTIIITTSGTAVANVLPAITEAYYAHLPLIVITADRPDYMKEKGHNQTIKQALLLKECCCKILDFTQTDTLQFTSNEQLKLADAIKKQSKSNQPIHINCQFEEPLFNKNMKISEGPKYDVIDIPENKKNNEVLLEVCMKIKQNDHGVIVCGDLPDESCFESILQLAKHLNWPIIADIQSHGRFIDDSHVWASFEIDPKSTSKKPSFCIQFGHHLISKKLMNWLKELPDSAQIKEVVSIQDPLEMFTTSITTKIKESAHFIRDNSQSKPNEWLKSCQLNNQLLHQELPFSEPYIAQSISQIAGKNSQWFIGNSSPIRDFNIYSVPYSKASIVVEANRGTSGIDGLVSTAIGFAEGAQKQLFAVIGDISFLHDGMALTLLKQTKVPIKWIVINNNGGRIFQRLPIKESPWLERYFTMPHHLSFKELAAFVSLPYTLVQSKNEWENFCKNSKIAKAELVEVKIYDTLNSYEKSDKKH